MKSFLRLNNSILHAFLLMSFQGLLCESFEIFFELPEIISAKKVRKVS
jgi:hypothetical protein